MTRLFGGMATLAIWAMVACGQATRDGVDDWWGSDTGGFGGNPADDAGVAARGGNDWLHSGGTSGASGSHATGPDSPACEELKAASFRDSCQMLFGDCPTDLDSFLASYRASSAPALPATATQGCGLIGIGASSGFAGAYFVFDQSGELVGYSTGQDTTYGVCEQFAYQAGALLDDCPEATGCRLAQSPTPDALCACSCPAAPASEILQTSWECVFTSVPRACEDVLLEQLFAASGSQGAWVTQGCGRTSVVAEETGMRCDYDATGNWQGAEVPNDRICPGVSRLQTGDLVPACGDASTCWLGQSEPEPGLEPCERPMPPR